MDNEEIGLSDNHKNDLKKFRSKLQDILTPDHTDAQLIKWLIGNNFDLKKAERMFREADCSRKVMGYDTILDTYTLPESFQNYARTAFLGFAKDGSAVRYYSAHSDVVGLVHCYSLPEALACLVYLMESDIKKLKEHNEKTGQNSTKITFIVDFEGVAYSEILNSVVISTGLECFEKFQEHYPEIWSKFLIVNAPYLFDKILMFFKPVFKSRFMDQFYVAMKSSTSTLLKKYIDEDIIPACLGGSRVDSTGDPNCREFIKEFRKVPPEYYLKNSRHFLDETDPDVEVAVLRPWSVYNIPIIVKEPRTKLRIEFRSDDSGFHTTIFHSHFSSDSEVVELPEQNQKLYPEDESSNLRVLTPKSKTQSHVCPEDFIMNAPWSGVYIIQFENSSSWFASRKVYYRITVLPPDS